MRRGLSAVVAICMAGTAHATPACFGPTETGVAYLRALQQAFNVTALSCAHDDAERDGLSRRYDSFVAKFGGVLQENARLLRAHFARNGGVSRLDQWMTIVANDAAERAVTDPQFCVHTAASLDKALALEPAQFKLFAASEAVGSEVVPVCAERRHTILRKARAVKKAAAKTDTATAGQ